MVYNPFVAGGRQSNQTKPSQAKPSQAKPSQVKPSQAKVLTGGGDLREAQATSPCLLAIPAYNRIAGLNNRHLSSNGGICFAYDFEVRLRALTDYAKY